MKKVLMAFSGSNFSDSAFEFARQLNDISPVIIVGFFLPEIVDPEHELHPNPLSIDEGEQIVTRNMNRFTELCEKNKLGYRVHIGSYELCMPQLIKETRFSDLFIASNDIFYSSFDSESPNYYIHKALHQAECPIIFVPMEFDFPENIIFAYDGSPASIYAIKQFAYLFPEFCLKNSFLVYADEHENATIPHQYQIEELTNAHFTDLKFLKLITEPRKYFGTWLADKRKSLLVAGSGGRSGLSEIIKKSFARGMIDARVTPVFVAHC